MPKTNAQVAAEVAASMKNASGIHGESTIYSVSHTPGASTMTVRLITGEVKTVTIS